jgi:hypothetical protein
VQIIWHQESTDKCATSHPWKIYSFHKIIKEMFSLFKIKNNIYIYIYIYIYIFLTYNLANKILFFLVIFLSCNMAWSMLKFKESQVRKNNNLKQNLVNFAYNLYTNCFCFYKKK